MILTNNSIRPIQGESTLTGATVNEGDVAFSCPVSFSSREVNIIQYLSGYVFGTVYRRIRRSNSTRRPEVCWNFRV